MRDKIKEKLNNFITDWSEKSVKRVYFKTDKNNIVQVAKAMFSDLGLRFITASAVDLPQQLEIIYHFSNDPAGEIYSVRVAIGNKENPEIDSIALLFPGAEWVEREIWEMFGINFKNHPNLKKLLLSDDWPKGDYPLRNKK